MKNISSNTNNKIITLPRQRHGKTIFQKTGALFSIAAITHMTYAPMAFATITVNNVTSANLTIGSGGTDTIMQVNSGGNAVNTVINSGGWQYLNANGNAANTTINSRGYQLIYNGGLANNTIVNSVGYQNVSIGGVANSTTISSGGFQQLYSNGIANSATIDGGNQYIYNGGIANSTTINTGYQIISSGGSAVDTTINNGGYQRVSNGGVANFTTISSGGAQNISSGGTALNTSQNAGGNVNVIVGGGVHLDTAATGTNENGSFSLNNGVADNFIIYSKGSQFVSSGGIAINTTISGGYQLVSSGGLVNGTTINGGSQYIYDDGSASSTFIIKGNQQVSAGGKTIETTIYSGANQYIFVGAEASVTNISSGGRQIVYEGGSSLNINQIEGGNIDVHICQNGSAIVSGSNASGNFGLSNGVASNFIIYFGGSQWVSAGGIANLTIISGGSQINSGGTVNFTTINSGGSQLTYSGGTANSTTVNSMGRQFIFSGGNTVNTTINSSGYQYIDENGLATSTTVNAGGYQVLSGGTSGGLALAGGSANYTLLSGGYQFIYNGGTANSTTVLSDGYQTISSGGTANSTTVSSGGYQRVSNGGVANSNLLKGGYQVIYSGGTASSTTVSSGGYQQVASGGFANITYVNSRGYQIVYNGGLSNDTNINYRGNQYVSSGGSALGTIVNSGGNMYLFDGSWTGNATFKGGGTLYVNAQSGAATYAGNLDMRGNNLGFYILEEVNNNQTMLHMTGGTMLVDETTSVSLYNRGSNSSYNNIQVGDSITLVDNVTDSVKSGYYTTSALQGATVHDFKVWHDDNNKHALMATYRGLNRGMTGENAKTYLEGKLAGLSHLNIAADLASDQGICQAWEETGKSGILVLWGGKTKAKTGSYIDLNTFNLLGGIATKKEIKNGNLMTGVFVDGGWGSYDSYNIFTTANVHGKGATEHYGLGFMAKAENNNGQYLEGYLRTGKVNTDYLTYDLGTGANFDSQSTYYGFYLGLGKVRKLKHNDVLDTYFKLFYTRQGSDTVTTGADERVIFDSVNSTRIRLGAKYIKEFQNKTKYYAGIAWEHEFSGKQKGTINDIDIDSPDMKGSSALIEIGTECELSSKWSMDFNLKGWLGKREGIGGSLSFNYKF